MMNENMIKSGQAGDCMRTFQRNRQAFSLVELLVVIAILALLVGILLPSLSAIRDQGYRTKSLAAITALSNGCLQYKSDNKYYPGQKDPSLLGVGGGLRSGSQALAFSLLEVDFSVSPFTIEENYIPYELGVTLMPTPGTYAFALSDRWKTDSELPILYYPSRIGNDGRVGNALETNPPENRGAFRIADNSTYATVNGQSTNASSSSDFRKIIWDKRFGIGDVTGGIPDDDDSANKAYNADTYLLFAAGVDRKYFTGDDIKNFDN